MANDEVSTQLATGMTVADHIRLEAQIAVLREVATEYGGKTIDNIIQQMKSRGAEVMKQETI